MGETFLIHVNCSKILMDNEETQYIMLVDTAKISIVYELIEWIRWIFSVETCVYLIHDNSVIHELEDIKLLSKLKNLEIKPCGQHRCIHNKIYRTLLNKFNLFVSWNETNVHKYFVDKIYQMEQNIFQKDITNDHITLLSNDKAHQNLTACNNFKHDATTSNSKDRLLTYKLLSDDQFSNSVMEDSPLVKKKALSSNIGFKMETNEKLTFKMNSHFEGKADPKNNNLNFLEGSYSFSNDLDNSLSQNFTSNIKKDTICEPSKNKSEHVQMTNKKSPKLNKSSGKHIKPFSLGEILFNIRQDFEKVACEKNTPINSSDFQEINFNEKIVDNVLMQGENTVEIKKRQRIRRRKKSKKQNVENKVLTSSCLGGTDNMETLHYNKPNDSLKPNHIRFDIDDEDNLMGSECKNEMKMQQEAEYEIIPEKMEDCSISAFKAEFEKSIDSNHHSLLDSKLQNSSINLQSNIEYSPAVSDRIQKEEKLIDLDDQACDNISSSYRATGNNPLESFNSDLNMLLSLKANCKSAVVIERF